MSILGMFLVKMVDTGNCQLLSFVQAKAFSFSTQQFVIQPQSRSHLSKDRGQPGRMVWQSHLNVKKVFIGHKKERKEFGGSNQKCFDHHSTYVDYSVTDAFYRASKGAKEVWELALRNIFHNYIPFNAREFPFAKN